MGTQTIAGFNQDVSEECTHCKEAPGTASHTRWMCNHFEPTRRGTDPQLAAIPRKYLIECIRCGIAPAMKTKGECTFWGMEVNEEETEQTKNSGLPKRFIQVIEKEKAHLNNKFAGDTPSRRNIFMAAKPTYEEKTLFADFVIDALEDKIDVVEEDSSIWKYENRISTMIDQIIPDTYEQSMSQRWLENIKRVATVIACYEWVVLCSII